MPDLITLIKGIQTAVRPVSITLVLLFLMIYVFGVVFRSQVKRGTELEDKYFSSVTHSMWTCLMHGTFLDEVHSVGADLRDQSKILLFFFLVSILCTNLMLLNMLIGITCEMVHVVKRAE